MLTWAEAGGLQCGDTPRLCPGSEIQRAGDREDARTGQQTRRSTSSGTARGATLISYLFEEVKTAAFRKTEITYYHKTHASHRRVPHRHPVPGNKDTEGCSLQHPSRAPEGSCLLTGKSDRQDPTSHLVLDARPPGLGEPESAVEAARLGVTAA